MKRLTVIAILLALVGALGEKSAARSPGSAGAVSAAAAAVHATLTDLPLSFEANRGQADARVRFLARGPDYTLYLTATGASLQLAPRPARASSARVPDAARSVPPGAIVRLRFLGANPHTRVIGSRLLPGKVNYFTGDNPRLWRTDVPLYSEIRYRDVYPGVDLAFYGRQGRPEYDWRLRPGADPRRIRLAMDGAGRLHIDHGGLVMQTGGRAVRQDRPVVYQPVAGGRRMISARYRLLANNQVGLVLGPHDARRPLVVDPSLRFATYLGGVVRAVTSDRAGHMFVTGSATAGRFLPAPGVRSGKNRQDTYVMVAELDPAAGSVLYATYLGGGTYAAGKGIAVDAAGDAYVAGQVTSAQFPTVGAVQTALRACRAAPAYTCDGLAAFALELNPTGDRLLYSTFLGGSRDAEASGIAIDGAGSAVVVGATDSADFPTAHAYQTRLGNTKDCFYLHLSCRDAFITRLSPAGDQLLFSTYFGGAGDDAASGVAVDGAGAIYVSGSSCPASSSSRADVPPEQGFPLVHPLQPSAGGQCSAFLTKLTATGTPVFSTFLPGPGVGVFNPMCVWNCPANSVAVDSLGNAVVSGSAGVAKVDAAGARMLYTAPVPGAAAVAMDTGGDAYVVGDLGKGLPRTDPTPDPLTSETGGHFLAKLSPAGALLYTTYLAGGSSIAPAPNGDTYVAGQALRSDLPLVHAIQAFSGDFTYGGAYVAVFSDQPAPPATPVPVPTAPPASPRACGKRPPARSAASLPRTVRLDWPPQAMAVAERDGLVFMAGVQGASGAGAVRVLDARSGSTLCTIVLPRLRGAGPMPYPPTPQPPARFAIAVDDGARRAFVLDRGDAAGRYESQVAVFDTGSGSLLRALPVGSHAVDLAIAQSAGRVFVLRQRPYARGGVLVLDAARGLPVRDVAAVAVQPLQMVSDERRHRDLVLETCLASGCTILRVLDAYRGHYTGKITAPPDSSDVETMRLVAGTDRLFLIGAGGGCRGGPVSVTTAIDLHTDRVVRSAADVDCDAITVGPVDERAGAVLVVDSAGCCGGTQLPRPHTLVLDGHTGRILRRLSPGLGVPAGIDERTGNVYFSSGDVVEPRGWTVVRRLNLPFQPDLAAVGQRSRRTFLAGRSAAARGPVTGMLSVVCADAGCS